MKRSGISSMFLLVLCKATVAICVCDVYGRTAFTIPPVSSCNSETTEYLANELNQYTSISNHANPVILSEFSPLYDPDGNMTFDGVFTYTWDAENRLASVSSNGVDTVTYAYDFMHRRVRKTTPSATHTYVYDGWNLIQETIAHSGTTSTVHYVWGLDISDTLQGAGGVGGLLAAIIDGVPYFPCYDANGNITEYVDSLGNIAAHYEYSPFGETIAQSGPLADAFAFRFSTKYHDPETGLYYYGRRYYLPPLGRFLSRDPIGEDGGLNLYTIVANNPVNKWDKLGMFSVSPSGTSSPASKNRTTIGVEGNWTYSAIWGTPPAMEPTLDVRVIYSMDESEKKCCGAVRVDRYVKKFWLWGPYVLDHGTMDGHTISDGASEDDAPNGPSFTLGLYYSSWAFAFKWVAVCAKGKMEGQILSTLMKTYRTEGHKAEAPYSGWFE